MRPSVRVSVYDPSASRVAAIEWRPCRFGGVRPYFRCPRCCGGALVLRAVGGGRYQCARCVRVSYACQREQFLDRQLRQARKIRKRLGGGPSLFERIVRKPKGMHWRTFNALRLKLAKYEALAVGAIAARFGLRLD